MPTGTKGSYEWLVIFLLHEDYILDEKSRYKAGYVKLEIQQKALIDSIKQHEYNKNNKIIVIESIIKKDKEHQPYARTYVRQKTKEGLEEYIVNTDGYVVQKGDSLKKLLRVILQKEEGANRHMIVTWGHGSIFGIFYLETLVQVLRNDVSNLLEKTDKSFTYNLPDPVLVKRITNPEAVYDPSPEFLSQKDAEAVLVNFDMLTNKELADALQATLDNKRVDVLLMYNCLMQNVCTQYDFRNVVDYLVAPETGISHPGYNYIDVLDYLNTPGGVSGGDVSRKIIGSLRNNSHFNSNPELLQELEDTWSISVIRLGGMDDNEKTKFEIFIDTIRGINAEILNHKNFDNIISGVNDVKKKCFTYAKFCLLPNLVVDLNTFMTGFVSKLHDDHEFSKLLSLVQESLQSIVNLNPDTDQGTNVFIDEFEKYIETKQPSLSSGLGLLFPTEAGQIDSIRTFFFTKKEFYPDFFVDTKYIELIQKVLPLLKGT